MNRSLFLACTAVCAVVLPLATSAADQAPVAKPPAKSSAASPPSREKSKGLALAKETVQRISEAQLLVADRVLTGQADCEFNQTVRVEAIAGQPGHFRVAHMKTVYTMVPEETSTGAVRLEDPKAGVVWLQIPSKSMLMNARLGQRVVDACMHAEQKAAVAAAEAAGRATAGPGLGIAPATGASVSGN